MQTGLLTLGAHAQRDLLCVSVYQSVSLSVTALARSFQPATNGTYGVFLEFKVVDFQTTLPVKIVA